MNDFVKDTTEIPSLSFGAPEPEPELPVQQPEEKKRSWMILFCPTNRKPW